MATMTQVLDVQARSQPAALARSNLGALYDADCKAGCIEGWVLAGSGVKECVCRQQSRLTRKLSLIPPVYRKFSLAALRSLPVGHENCHHKQAALIADAQANPSASYFLPGKTGVGKSLVGWMLYREAVLAGRQVVAMPLTRWLGQARRWERDEQHQPSVVADDLRSDGRWLIFFDEFEKARATPFTGEALSLLMDAIYCYGHQLIVCSNVNRDALHAHWAQAGEGYGGSIVRRILEVEGMTEVEMF